MIILPICMAIACGLGPSPRLAAGSSGQQQPAVPPPPPSTAARPTPVPAPQAPAPPTSRPSGGAARRPQSRGFLAAGGLFQPEKTSFTDEGTLTYFRELATRTGEYEIDAGAGFDVGGFARLWRGLGAGVALTQVSRTGEATFSGSYPHPFFFGQPRSAETSASDLDRTETGVHVSAAFLVPSSGRFGLTIFGGPSFFSMKQDVVDDLTVTEAYPYDTVALAPSTRSDTSESAIGFHVGADATWYFIRRLGAGALVRYASASKSVAIGSGESFDLKAGGLQIGVGLRFKF